MPGHGQMEMTVTEDMAAEFPELQGFVGLKFERLRITRKKLRWLLDKQKSRRTNKGGPDTVQNSSPPLYCCQRVR
jgi:hypothetical protein